jgi:hypothetical protein
LIIRGFLLKNNFNKKKMRKFKSRSSFVLSWSGFGLRIEVTKHWENLVNSLRKRRNQRKRRKNT